MSAPERDGPARWRQIARVTIELTSPLMIGTGGSTAFADNAVVTDANDLPAIPGATLAGVLRAAWRAAGHTPDHNELFGCQDGDEGDRSRLLVSWGAIHGADNVPVPARLPPGAVDADPVLADARGLILRDHVRIGHRGVVDGRGKFDRSAVRAGHRFTFELELDCFTEPAPDDDTLRRLIDLLHHPAVRLGGATRAGLGAFTVARAVVRTFDLKRDLDAYLELGAELRDAGGDLERYTPTPRGAAGRRFCLRLEPAEPFAIGGGDPDTWPRPKGRSREQSPPDLLPCREARIEWPDDRGRLGDAHWCVPATAIKGALRHRTAFWLRALDEQWVGTHLERPATHSDFDPWGPQALPGIQRLFGHVHDERTGTGAQTDDTESGAPGRVLLSDARPAGATPRTATHVSIDRFTGAPMDGHLFEDEALEGGTLDVELVLVDAPDDAPETKAFLRAVEDLCNERLQLGAGFGRGYGFFRGQLIEETER